MRLRVFAFVFGAIVLGCATPAPPSNTQLAPPANTMLLARDAAREVLVIRGLVRAGSIDQAAGRVAGIADTKALYDLRTLREFEPLWNHPNAETYLRPEDFASRHIAATRALSERDPKNLNARADLLFALLLNGRYDEVVSTAQDTLSHLSSYRASEEGEAWVRNQLAFALTYLGKYDDATNAIKPVVRAATIRDPYLVNFSINYGILSLYHGRYDEARNAAELSARGPISNYARNLIRFTDACALHFLNRRGEAEKALDDMLASPAQSPLVTLDTLVCFDRTDQAAAALVKLMADDGLRNQALRKVQDCTENPTLPRFIRDEHTKFVALRERSEVRQAIASVGIIIVKPSLCGMFD